MAQHDFILLDRSSSMASRWGEALSSVNAYVHTLKDEEVETEVTVIAFDMHLGKCTFDVVRNAVSPDGWADITTAEISPRGGTPLNDAIGMLVERANLNEWEKAALIIMTDGEELNSRKLSRAQAKAKLDECRAKGWQVLFLSADFDATQQAVGYGTGLDQTISVSSVNLVGTMRQTGAMRSLYGSGAAATMSYNDAVRTRATPTSGTGSGTTFRFEQTDN